MLYNPTQPILLSATLRRVSEGKCQVYKIEGSPGHVKQFKIPVLYSVLKIPYFFPSCIPWRWTSNVYSYMKPSLTPTKSCSSRLLWCYVYLSPCLHICPFTCEVLKDRNQTFPPLNAWFLVHVSLLHRKHLNIRRIRGSTHKGLSVLLSFKNASERIVSI